MSPFNAGLVLIYAISLPLGLLSSWLYHRAMWDTATLNSKVRMPLIYGGIAVAVAALVTGLLLIKTDKLGLNRSTWQLLVAILPSLVATGLTARVLHAHRDRAAGCKYVYGRHGSILHVIVEQIVLWLFLLDRLSFQYYIPFLFVSMWLSSRYRTERVVSYEPETLPLFDELAHIVDERCTWPKKIRVVSLAEKARTGVIPLMVRTSGFSGWKTVTIPVHNFILHDPDVISARFARQHSGSRGGAESAAIIVTCVIVVLLCAALFAISIILGLIASIIVVITAVGFIHMNSASDGNSFAIAYNTWRSADKLQDRSVEQFVSALAMYHAYSHQIRKPEVVILQLRRNWFLMRWLGSLGGGSIQSAMTAARERLAAEYEIETPGNPGHACATAS